ncbi:histidine--tRNA ligase [Thermospira aquatica]|uniref:Histidine--tRNA ligase n=1 Tax=Thermospira aquatica TaxID=2828656 RepID=A0AAX3BFR2_9SPIR|nr:histidine--tRNA ligase [Thermospira aquatica]URA11132.1 histidine--tRNA ligase [Thermospira aquatica]
MYQKLKGTYDILPGESDFFRWLKKEVEEVAHLYGYKEVQFPIIEHASLFQRGVGESSDIVVKKEMYTFEDRGHRLVALRPEGTAGAVRLYVENNLHMSGHTQRMYYVGPMFRAENPQAGRYRQFTQFGFELIGDPTPEADVELIAINNAIVKRLGITEVTLFINSIGCRECRPLYQQKLTAYFQSRRNELCEDCQTRLDVNPLRILDCKEASCQAIVRQAPIQHEHLCEICQDHFEKVKSSLYDLGIAFEIDPYLVRGLDYYNRTVFEFKSQALGAQSTFSAGGRYDYLVKDLGGMDTPASGFAMGMERLAMVVEASLGKNRTDFYHPPFVYVAGIGENIQHAVWKGLQLLRQDGISATTEFRYTQLKKHLKSADKLRCAYALLLGEDEVKTGRWTLRNLQTGEQLQETPENIVAFLRARMNA